MKHLHYLTALVLLSSLACDVDSTSPEQQGVDLGNNKPSKTNKEPDAAVPEGPEGRPARRGFYVIESDYMAANVSVYDSEGTPQSFSLISSGSTNAGLSAALTGDVVAPSSVVDGNDLVLIDRGTNTTLNWVNLESTKVTQQLNVGPGGFAANPQDYIPYDKHRAFVPRFKTNHMATGSGFDQGGDILVIDPSDASLTASIDLSGLFETEMVDPTPTRAVMAGGLLRVTAIGWDQINYASGRLISIDPESLAIVDVQTFTSLQNCSNLAVSPDGMQLAIACAGPYGDKALDFSGIVVVNTDAEAGEAVIYPATDLGGETINTLEFTGSKTLAFTTFGRLDFAAETPKLLATDTLRLLNLETGMPSDPVAVSEGTAYALNEIRCIPEAKTCIVTDASFGAEALRRFGVNDDGTLTEKAPVTFADGLKLPPRYIGVY